MTDQRCETDLDDAGIVDVAVAVIVLLLVAFFAVGAMRLTTSKGEATAAAYAGARAAAAEYDPVAAQAAAQRVAGNVLASRGVACQNLAVTVSGQLVAGGVVTVTVSCTVGLSDVSPAGFTSARTLTGRGVEAVDVVRGGA
jgi:Flp pilus assembly protein TadG